jgi:hypothetical protein
VVYGKPSLCCGFFLVVYRSKATMGFITRSQMFDLRLFLAVLSDFRGFNE